VQAATHGVAVDRSDEHRPRFLEGFEGGAEMLRHEACVRLVAVREFLQIRTGAEEFIALAGDHRRAHLRIAIQFPDERMELLQSRGGKGVGGGIVERHHRDRSVDCAVDHFKLMVVFTAPEVVLSSNQREVTVFVCV